MTEDKMEEASIAFWYRNLVQMQPPPTLQYWADCQVYSAQESTETGSLSRFTFHYLVGADPDDTLILQVKGGVWETFRMHSSAWRWSLDYLLYRYLTLALREGDQATITLRVPDAILKKYDSYKNQMTERKKELSIPTPAYLPKPS